MKKQLMILGIFGIFLILILVYRWYINIEINRAEKNASTAVESLVQKMEQTATQLAAEQDKQQDKQDDFKKFIRHICWKEYWEVAETLSLHPPFVNKSEDDLGMTPLMYAVFTHSDNSDAFEIIELLLEKGANVNAKDKFGGTALHNAVWFGNFKAVYLLLQHKADVNVKDRNEQTPLDVALSVIGTDFKPRVDKQIVDLLIKSGGKHGSNPSYPDET